ncbi:MAG: PAS domain S-box protein [Thermoleophilia bacterium]
MSDKPLASDQRTPAAREGDQITPYLAATVASFDGAVIGMSLDGTIVLWNDAAERLYGYAAVEAVGRNVSLIVPLAGRDEFSDLLARALRGERSEQKQTQRQHKDGASISVALSIASVYDPQGRIVGATTITHGVAMDSGDAANEAAAYARSLIEMSINPLVTINPAGKISDVNLATEEATGIAREQLIGSDFADCFSEPEKARTAYERVLEEGLLSDYPLVLRHLSGALTEVEYNATVYRDESGELKAVFAAARDASEAQQARLQMARLAAIAASSQDALYTRDLEGAIVSWNTAAGTLYGYTAQEAIGRNGSILMPPGHAGETQELMKRVLSEKCGFGFVTKRRCKDGSLLDVALTIAPVRDRAGDIVAMSVSGHDISERLRAERKLRESEEKFSAAFYASPDLMAMTELNTGKILEVNEGYTQLLGYTHAETIGKTTAELSLWVDPAERATFAASLKESGQIDHFETTLRGRNGSLIACIVSARTIEVQDKTCILAVVHNISERKRSEEALRESEAHLRTLVDTIPDLVWLKDPEGVYLSCNRRFESFFGAAEKDIVGKTDYDFTDRELADSFRHRDEAAMVAASPTVNEEEIVFAEDGHRELLETIKAPVYASDGQLMGVLGISRDITQRKHAEEEARRQAQQLQTVTEEVIAAIADIVEVRDPYTAGHERRVSELAEAIAVHLGLDEVTVMGVRVAALLHDVGKITVPAEILAKPGRLSEIEFELIKAHPQATYNVLHGIEFPWPVAEVALQHHERLDGSGYPRGLAGEEIMLEARILAVADVVEAMASHRPYRSALGIEAALEEIAAHRGTLFDADVADACRAVFSEEGFAFA